nr:MAG TPA: hypothetical protein [Caudoviricetes sp.]
MKQTIQGGDLNVKNLFYYIFYSSMDYKWIHFYCFCIRI